MCFKNKTTNVLCKMGGIPELHEWVKRAKVQVMDICLRAGYGHPSSAYALAEIFCFLYGNILRYDVNNPGWEDRDRLVISNNHASVMLFPILHDVGFISDEEYQTIMTPGSPRSNHTNCHLPGMDFTGGALGVGLGIAAGIAKAGQMSGKDYLTVCVVGDAECCEGNIWESAMFAGHNKLKNLIVIFDNNNMGVSDYTSNMITMEPIEERWGSFGFETCRINGHDFTQLQKAFCNVRKRASDKPLCIIADTIKGNGLPLMANKLMWHGTLPKGADIQLAYKQLQQEEE